ncbi:phosphatase PAP2 family protein [Macrococcus epidermidis]|uniref:phosphatase PAP2 family protein n=1 Tax=Macrococcus epidermidis TaxID=1902580 RepID=UPI0020B84CF2|nr:phosphatase PAP2 family protein [Macrococcus epidermidis]UTH16346.1 phosphatase PAP2 family protein [Macrococcus epidermidis]
MIDYRYSKRFIIIISVFFLSIFLSISAGLELKVKWIHHMDLSTFNWWMYHFGEPQMNFSSGFITGYFTIFAKYFDVLTVVGMTLVTAVYFIRKHYYVFSIWLITVVASGGILGILLKKLFHRPRPYDHLLQDTGFSFPSGHSLSSTLFALIVLIILIPRLQKFFPQFIANVLVLVCWWSILLSRMYFHAHFLTDVIGGVTFSVFWIMLCMVMYDKIFEPVGNKIIKNNNKLNLMK